MADRGLGVRGIGDSWEEGFVGRCAGDKGLFLAKLLTELKPS